MTVYKNDKGLWSIRYKYKDNNGVWQQKMAYSGKSGFTRKKDAIEKEKDIIQEIQTSLLKSLENNHHKTFKEVMDEALLECKFYMKETSIKTTIQALNHAESLFNDFIDEITPQQLRQIMINLIKKDLSIGTMDKIYYKINLVFKYALENDYININPLSKAN